MKIALVGAGYWGINLLRVLNELNVLSIVCDSDAGVLKNVSQLHPELRTTSNLEETLSSDVDAVVVATPAKTHFEIARKAIEAGKDVFVEKPLALSLHEAEKLKDLSSDRKRILMVGHILRYHPAVEKLKELIADGKLGRINYIYSNRLNFGKLRVEENILWSFAPHDISIIQFLVGSNPDHVEARGASFLQSNIEDSTITYLSYPGNIHAHIFVSWLHPFKEQRLVVIGDKGMMVFEDSAAKEKLKFYPKSFNNVNGTIQKLDGEFEVISHDDKQPLAEEQNHFVKCITENRRPLTDGRHALEVLKILKRAERSLKKVKSE